MPTIQKDFNLKDKIALVTGATGHLGQEMAIGLASAGAHVLVNSRSKEKAKKTVLLIKKLGLSAETACFDVTKNKAVDIFFSKYKDKLNVLVNNAYLGSGYGTIKTSSTEQFRKSYEVSLVASHNLIRSSLASLRKAVLKDGDASVINISSIYGIISPELSLYSSVKKPSTPFYGAAKAALIQYTKYAAVEFGKEKIRVNAISPGPFPSLEVQKKDPSLIKRLSKKVSLNRIGKESELRGPVIFLASDASSYVNGANLVVDGGWTAW
jgi:NAD(P)-dependent dehydrogenase (short-subunit alcohol dehydrogenase family)|tara:strand:- start:133 stop:933 length:801 start_codon:yes stop_codon:yes gene_type:complete